MLRVDLAHGVGIGVVPGREVFHARIARIAQLDGVNEVALEGGYLGLQRFRPRDGLRGLGEGGRLLVLLEGLPGLVVVRADGVGDAPVRHGAVGIGFQRLLEADDGFFVVVAVGPDEAAVEPGLGFG